MRRWIAWIMSYMLVVVAEGSSIPGGRLDPVATGGLGLDMNGNGMSDTWEAYFSAHTLMPEEDEDQDGASNSDESIAGTDPRDRTSNLDVQSFQFQRGGEQLQLSWFAVTGKLYQIQIADDLGNSWLPVGGPVSNQVSNVTVQVTLPPGGSGGRYWRIQVRDLDQDGDGLTATEEAVLGFSDALPASSGAPDFGAAIAAMEAVDSIALGDRMVDRVRPSLAQASRFLTQSTMGANWEMIQSVTNQGYARWIDQQMALPPSYHLPRNIELMVSFEEPEGTVSLSPFIWSWTDRAMSAPDVLRQRVAFALSQILVVSDRLDVLEDQGWALAGYYDILMDGAFGNYRDTLYRVSNSPVMGLYLSHARNRRSNPAENRFPDENYARELMQLFSIGLFELNIDGTRKKDESGRDIPTYTNADITEFAKVFTGLTFNPLDPGNGIPFESFEDDFIIDSEQAFLDSNSDWLNRPMIPYEPMHEPGPKSLLQGVVIPGGTVDEDIRAAIDHLFNHPNVGPFIGYRLIQRLVTSNPSPAYVARVARAFNDNGSGIRGDMGAVIKAILLDPEARDLGYFNEPHYGRLREPWVRYVQLCRAFDAVTPSGAFRNDAEYATVATRQRPLNSPSVFNFYLPGFQPQGVLASAGLVAPEFQITTAVSSVQTMNYWAMGIPDTYFLMQSEFPEEEITLDWSDELALADQPERLLDRLDVLLTRGALEPTARTVILSALQQAQADGTAEDIVALAIYLLMNTPDFAVFR